MTRNTIRRVEVAALIYDTNLKKRIREMFECMLKDDEKGMEQYADGTYHHRSLNPQLFNSQEYFYDIAGED